MTRELAFIEDVCNWMEGVIEDGNLPADSYERGIHLQDRGLEILNSGEQPEIDMGDMDEDTC